MPDDHADPSQRAQIDPESTFSLIERARAGDEQALERLFARHLAPLRRWASGRVPVRRSRTNGGGETNVSL